MNPARPELLPSATPPTLVFAHANGFPAGTYRALFEVWQHAGWRVLAPAKFGHDPAWPVQSNWRPSRDELIGFIEREASGAPVQLVGHSLGGYLSLLVACRRPDLVRSVVMLDSPVLDGWRAHGVRIFKSAGLIGRVSPGRSSRRRRHHWPDQDAVRAHFASRRAFAGWDARVLADYVEAGFEPDPGGGVRLAFRREIETRFYNTLPHHLGGLLRRRPPKAPVAFIGGTRSAELRQVGLAATRRLVRERFAWIEGTHLFPMEHPGQTAQTVLALIDGR
ncbi:MAG: alpha/beta hydrolase [Burkholderiales bacterium]|nr:alpha/beta hydrolase [Burkholderiales bacterium]